ncbi:MAG TPA: diaminopimelate decarboxylase [Stenomitos sp.]
MPLTDQACNQHIRPMTARVNAHGRWEIGGCDLGELARTYGTPLYVMDEDTIRNAAQAYLKAIKAHYPGPSEVLYASKALCNLAINRLVHEEGMGTEVVSGGELFTALKAGIPPERIHFQGNNKSPEELRLALEEGIGRFMVDNLDELVLLGSIAAELGVRPQVILRVTPGIEAHTHEYIRTGHIDTKFGLDLPQQLDEAMRYLRSHPHLQFRGLQGHIGSQIFDLDPYLANVDVLLDLSVHLERTHGVHVSEIDVGGGLGIAYVESDDPPSIEALVAAIAERMVSGCQERKLDLPKLLLEPGRSIVGTAGVTVYSVGTRKDIPGVRTFLSVDGGMPDNPRPITYGAQYVAEAVQVASVEEVVTLAGKCCESGDVLITDLGLPRLKAGDQIVVWDTGAYCYSMASNYNRLGRPAMVLVADGKADVIAERETLADLVSRDRLPPRLGGSR